MTSCHVITGHAASAGNSMTWFYNTTPATVVTKQRLPVSRAMNRITYGLVTRADSPSNQGRVH